MRDLRDLDRYRWDGGERRLGINPDRSRCGLFLIVRKGVTLRTLASTGEGWDHVSVSTASRCPTWEEMEHIKRLFFREDEAAMQLHPPLADYRNCHPHCLHIWRPHFESKPMPDPLLVAPPQALVLP